MGSSAMKKKKVFLKALSVLLAVITAGAALYSNGAAAESKEGAALFAESSYYRYMLKNENTVYADGECRGVLSAAVNAETVTPGENTGLAVSEGGYAEYTLDIPKTALYYISLKYSYLTDTSKVNELAFSFELNGEKPFEEAGSCTLRRVWENDGDMKTDGLGNDLIQKQKQVAVWQECGITDYSGYSTSPFIIKLESGKNVLRFNALSDGIIFGDLRLLPPQNLKNKNEAIKNYEEQGKEIIKDDTFIYIEAEDAAYKSDRTLYPVYDRSNSATSPNSPYALKRNIIGGAGWSKPGMYITYTVNAPRDGLYFLTLKYRQNTGIGMSVLRNIYINGEIPYKELSSVSFPYSSGWRNKTVSDENGGVCLIPLKKGKNTVSLEVTADGFAEALNRVDAVSREMNSLYRRIIMITSTSPDLYRDYYLEREIPDIGERFSALSTALTSAAEMYEKANGGKTGGSSGLKRAAEQLGEFAKKPSEIPARLSSFRSNISLLSDFAVSAKNQPMELDYLIFHGEGYRLPSAKGNIISNAVFSFKRFISAFSDDYDSMSEYDDAEAVNVWLNDGRDQAQILKNLISDFTEETKIPVNVNLVQGGLTESALTGNNPDVAVGVSRGQPINLASRNALEDLKGYKGFDETAKRFTDDALVPYTRKNGVYALPLTQVYLVMFVRTDILNELKISVPQTWNELLDVTARLQRNNMTVGLPYTAVTASGAVDLGLGAKDLFPTLLMQCGGSFYNKTLTGAALSDSAALAAFELWTKFYTQYSFELSYDFNTRFRTGEMPIAVASYGMYGTLMSAAPEIRGLWKMELMPGIEKNGGIDRSGGASGTAVVMFKNARNKENCWRFMQWLTSADVQTDYGTAAENLLGAAARHATANLEAFGNLNWTRAELEILNGQRACVKEIPEIPGGYYTSRCIDNAFREVLYQHGNTRVALENANAAIDREIKRKITELGG